MTGYVITKGTRDEFLVVLRTDEESSVRQLVKWLESDTDAGSQALAEEILASVNGLNDSD